ncbi:MAG TPA: choice-of-anchor tandem repeat GloVer-containing protein [Rhizomicrobium sp.]|nr:choice-of-anchor tandem repeat GloVer-containing protein [Rhizomicrobium sp.]
MRMKLFAGATALAVCLSGLSASAAALKTLYSFCAPSSCNSGFDFVYYGPILGQDGNLYGITYGAGANKGGMVYQLVPNADHSAWAFTDIHDFGGVEGAGYWPLSGLIQDAQGNLYGTTTSGGAHHEGQVFKLSKKGRTWKFASLYDFCPDEENCSDGMGPQGSLTYAGAASGSPYDGTSPLYGIALGPGGGTNARVAFTLTPKGKTWKEKIIHGFGSDRLPNQGTLMVGADGSLFGAHAVGDWTAFKLAPNAKHTKWKLHDFDAVGNDANGDQIVDATGAMFGTTQSGFSNNGNVYKLDPGTGSVHVLYEFCALADCSDGKFSAGGMKLTGSGDLLGLTAVGGGHDIDITGQGGGTIYKLHKGKLQTLYAFCAQSNCGDGEYPVSSPTLDASGNVFGATADGGANGGGTVFELVP